MLAYRLATIHNVRFYIELMEIIRREIERKRNFYEESSFSMAGQTNGGLPWLKRELESRVIKWLFLSCQIPSNQTWGVVIDVSRDRKTG